ncbi:ATP-NAD kinase family protein [Spongiibacter sp. UBA1325]|uniref:ATP-NAD kinase family protein n=1 Tax=Spongiibacter sp. UBA1325 TaxID=1947543 RepID=UPI00257DFEB1|nr:ATP-NAD kinase family protein [Spongiibacter sp. UBA1325]|tara:strand:- start:2867 stop:4000 length:1134 start_codon:yes stop_codon:yes gene_type:complete
MFKLGLIVNPYAGLGGPEGLKGSDTLPDGLRQSVAEEMANSRSLPRAVRCLAALAPVAEQLAVYGFDGAMAEQACREAGLTFTSVGRAEALSSAEDTRRAAQCLLSEQVDIVLFVGGDGTARDIYSAVGQSLPVLGLPAGVKMHSAVYAVNPQAAAAILRALIDGDLVDIGLQEVRDIDEAAFAQGRVRSRHYGELMVPRLGGFLQQVKQGGREVEELVIADIADELMENYDEDCLYIVGPGSTTTGFMEALGLPYTLLGFDLVRGGELLQADANAQQISEVMDHHQGPITVLITAIGGQGHILGRGNQQLTPALIRRIGRDNFQVLASKGKLSGLAGRPLLVDSNDAALDAQWQGFIAVTTGYRDQVMYRVSAGEV